MKLVDAIEYSNQKFNHKIHLKTDDFTIHLFAFVIGQELTEHKSNKNAFLSVLDGNAKIVMNNEEIILGVNDTFLIPKDMPHSLHAIESFKIMLVK